MEQLIKDAKSRMDKTIEALRHELIRIRTGKASAGLLDGIKVDYYGTMTPLNQVGNVSTLDAHTLVVTPWDKSAIQAIDKAIRTSEMGFNPVNDGTNVKVPIPPLTEERRKEIVKMVKKIAEDAKIAIRNVRRDTNEHLKKRQKDEKLPEDSLKDAESKVQKMTDEHISLIDDILKHKEKEILEV